MRFHTYAQHYNFKAIENLLHMQFSGRVELLQGDSEPLCDGITCIRMGGHTPGLLSIAVETGKNTKIICSDVIPRYQNISEMTPCGIHYNVTEALMALEKIESIAKSTENILPGHDPEITARYPQTAPGVYRVS